MSVCVCLCMDVDDVCVGGGHVSKTDDWCRLGVRTCVGHRVTHPALCWALSHPPCSVLGTESPTLLCVGH